MTVRRGERSVLSDLSLELEESRVVLIGRNGSGKTTLAQLIKGLLVPDEGRVRVWGLDSATRTAGSAAAVGFLFQNSDHQILCPTVLEEIAFGPIEPGLSREEAQRASLATMRARHRRLARPRGGNPLGRPAPPRLPPGNPGPGAAPAGP